MFLCPFSLLCGSGSVRVNILSVSVGCSCCTHPAVSPLPFLLLIEIGDVMKLFSAATLVSLPGVNERVLCCARAHKASMHPSLP